MTPGSGSTRRNGRTPIFPPAYFLLAAILMIGLHFLVPLRQIVPGSWRYLGLVPLALGPGLVLWCARLFQRAGTAIKPFQTSSKLVLGGPYCFSRNPIYLGMIFGLLGVGLLAGSATPFLVVPVYAYLIDRRFIRTEEAMLAQAFGAEYATYRQRVRRWL